MQEMLEQMQKDVDEMRRSLKGRCQYLEARCGSLERTLQAVIKAQNEWEYPVAPVPTSHWTDLGFDDDYVAAMESFLDIL